MEVSGVTVMDGVCHGRKETECEFLGRDVRVLGWHLGVSA